MTEPLLPGLRQELIDAARRRANETGPRRRWLRVAPLAAAAALIVGVVIAVTVSDTDPASAGVEITVENGIIEVRLAELESRPDFVQNALRDAGIDATVTGVPVGPSRLGHFVGTGTAVTEELQPLEPDGPTFPGFLIPEDYEGDLELLLGRPAGEDEPYEVTSDAYAAGEPLSCLDAYGRTPGAVIDTLPDRLRIRFQPYVDGAPSGVPLDPDQLSGSGFEDFRASDALALSASEVLVSVTADGRSPFATPLSPNAGACEE